MAKCGSAPLRRKGQWRDQSLVLHGQFLRI